MCAITKIDNLNAVKKTGKSVKKLTPSPGGGGSGGGPSPAFQGARFDKSGYCLKHPSVQLVKPMKDNDNGKLVYQELKVSCPSCQSIKHRSMKNTSLGGGKVRSGHRVHGTPKASSSSGGGGSSSRRSRSKSREPSRDDGNNDNAGMRRSASKSRERSRARPEYDTPFDSKGRCHYHKNVQLAAKKQFGGGWKVLHSICPKCIEGEGDGDGGGDDRSVRSGHSRKSTRSGGGGGGNAHGRFDKNGCCEVHTHIQVAKKRFLGSGWKVARACPACEGGDVDVDDYSVKSERSARSASSRRSTRSAKSTKSRGKSSAGKATSSGRYGALPFDADGYCCRHPNVQLAKKKTLGGFKIVHDVCPECAGDADGDGRLGGRRKPARRKSGTGRVFDDSGSETSSFRSGRSGGGSTARRKSRIRVRNLKTEDEEGRPGKYSGYVNDDHQPHGNGVMSYADGTVYEGVWSEGSKVHGKTKVKVRSGGGSSSSRKG